VSATPQDESDDGAAGGTGGANEPEPSAEEYLDGQEEDSFPASDPHSDWSGPPERT
jgi:hypothetical protein